ncbi:hypothetical protein PJ985_08180 [Streptomyces sp. ACA25]|uniref:hypothetical protein n=1 Tax=Streptomyces sp. ACA25 TaxID=3022596 RepID=UPI00230727B8|nr:hypothetical protein [Streptomyces sp. ACA25]MDB1087542.1 hypothetical protein [Streptomyces sp. ACA25]
MSDNPAPDDRPSVTVRPRGVAVAALLTGLEGVVIAGLGVAMLVLLAVGEPDGVLQAATGAVTVLVLSVLPLLAGHGLWRLRRWSRGPAVITQVLALPASWHMFQIGGLWTASAVVLALLAVVVLGCLMNPVAAAALGVVPPHR